MSSLRTELGIDQLSPAEQIQLVEEILSGLPERPVPPLSESSRAELDRRLASLDAGKTPVTPWKDVEARILRRMQG